MPPLDPNIRATLPPIVQAYLDTQDQTIKRLSDALTHYVRDDSPDAGRIAWKALHPDP